MSLYQDIYDIVRRIPVATVTSYGRIARMVNCNARQVGYAMAATPDDQAIPWHRAINSKGEISARKQGSSDQRQRQKLIDEGVIFDQKGRVSFDEFGWRTAEIPPMSEGGAENWPEDWPHPDAWPSDQPQTEEPQPSGKQEDLTPQKSTDK